MALENSPLRFKAGWYFQTLGTDWLAPIYWKFKADGPRAAVIKSKQIIEKIEGRIKTLAPTINICRKSR